MPKTTISFLNALYGDLPEGAYIEIWEKDSKLSSYAATFEDAATMAHSAAGDVYFGVCLGGEGVPHLRHKATDKTFAPALWVDIDVESPHHGKSNLAPNTNAVFGVLSSECPVTPSCVVETGGGVHAYWFLDELLDLTDGDLDRGRFAAVVKGWQALIRDIFARHGWHGGVDPTHDLARVLRVPGSYNVSAGFKSELRSLYEDMRYPLDEFEQYTSLVLDANERAMTFVNDSSWGHIDVVPRRGYSEDDFRLRSKVEALLATNENFRASYSGYNPNLHHDDSRSSIDFSLAVTMCRCHTNGEAYFTDQDICDVLVDLRFRFAKNWKDEKKAMRRDYYQSTIGKARKLIADERALEQTVAAPVPVERYERPFTETIGEEPKPDVVAQEAVVEILPVAELSVPELADDDSPFSHIPEIHPAKADKWKEIGDKLNDFIILRALRYVGGGKSQTHLVVQSKRFGKVFEIALPTSVLMSRRKTAEAFYSVTGIIPGGLKSSKVALNAQEWEDLIESIAQNCPEVPFPEEATDSGSVISALKHFIEEMCHGREIGEIGFLDEEKHKCELPFLYKGYLYVKSSAVLRHIRINSLCDVNTMTALVGQFTTLGLVKRQCKYTNDEGKKKTLDAYQLPAHLIRKMFGDEVLERDPNLSPFDKGEVRRISLQ